VRDSWQWKENGPVSTGSIMASWAGSI